jgi:hypothetical protein
MERSVPETPARSQSGFAPSLLCPTDARTSPGVSGDYGAKSVTR